MRSTPWGASTQNERIYTAAFDLRGPVRWGVLSTMPMALSPSRAQKSFYTASVENNPTGVSTLADWCLSLIDKAWIGINAAVALVVVRLISKWR